MHVTKRIDLPLLEQELAAASIVVSDLGSSGTDTDGEVYTYDENRWPTDLPAAAAPVVDAHVAPPRVVEFAGERAVSSVVRTTDEVPKEVLRFPTEVKHVYRGTFRMTAIDAGNGVTKDSEVRLVFKRTGAGLAQVGTTVALSNCQDAAASTWGIQAAPAGTDLVISVRGAAGRTVDWLFSGEVGVYAPEGLGG